MLKLSNKKIYIYLILSSSLSLITVFYQLNKIDNLLLIFESFIYFLIIILLNDLIIRRVYIRTNIPSPIKIILNILLGLILLVLGRYIAYPFSLYNILTFDLFLIIFFPILIIIDVNLDYYLRKSFEKYNKHLRNFKYEKD